MNQPLPVRPPLHGLEIAGPKNLGVQQMYAMPQFSKIIFDRQKIKLKSKVISNNSQIHYIMLSRLKVNVRFIT